MGNPGHGNVEFKEKSGQAIAYQTDVRLDNYFEPWRVGKEDTQIGQKILVPVQHLVLPVVRLLAFSDMEKDR